MNIKVYYLVVILEPITSISRLIILNFHDVGTKISIRDHKIVLCKKEKKLMDGYFDNKIFQGVDRYLNGDSRNDMYILNHVIYNFIEWYIIPYKNNNEYQELYSNLINVVKYLCLALQKLQKTYGTGNVVCVLQYYIIVLKSIINDTFEEDMLYNYISSENLEEANTYGTILDTDKLKHFWSVPELESIMYQLNKCFEISQDKSIINYMPCDQSNAIVEGTLVGIKSILNKMDDKFTSIIIQSMKGTK